MVGLAHLRWATGGVSPFYFIMLWLVPLNSSFMYFMFLRDVYQHSNADAGRLTNSRVFFTDPFTRWAVFVYGQDMHIPHHLFPAVPHYHLPRLHDLLKRENDMYRSQVVETHGTFQDLMGRPTILDEMTRRRFWPSRLPTPESPERARAREDAAFRRGRPLSYIRWSGSVIESPRNGPTTTFVARPVDARK